MNIIEKYYKLHPGQVLVMWWQVSNGTNSQRNTCLRGVVVKTLVSTQSYRVPFFAGASGCIHEKHHATHLLAMHVTNHCFDRAHDIS